MGVILEGHIPDCLAGIPSRSVSLIHADPPYFRVVGEEWDRRWKSPAAYLDWLGTVADEWRRILAPNGSLYCWASPRMAARVEVAIGARFEVLNSIVWAKPEPSSMLRYGVENFRAYVGNTERLIFAEHFGADSMALGESGYAAQCETLRGFVFEPLRAYLDGERERAAVSKVEINEACGFSPTPGGMASRKYFSRSQWQLPRPEHYAAMRELFNRDGRGECLCRDYEDLRQEYEDLHCEYEHQRRKYEHLRRDYEDLRRPFSVSADVPHTDLWEYPTVEPGRGRHPCAKPVEMMRDILRASTRPGDLVLDCFAGSGAMPSAAIDTGRRWITVESCPKWCREIAARTARHEEAATGNLQPRVMAKIRGPLWGS